jgi:hypothetical protein
VRQTQIDEERPAANLNRRKEAELESYGWVDRARGIVRIPIERAMEEEIEQAAVDARAKQ